MRSAGAAAALCLLAARAGVAAQPALPPRVLDGPLPALVRICVQPYAPFVLPRVRRGCDPMPRFRTFNCCRARS